MILSPESVNAYKELLTDPKKHGLPFKPITEVLVKTETVTAQHVLFKQFIDYLKRDLPKVIFYILLQEIFGPCTGKDESGCAGYHLTVKVD